MLRICISSIIDQCDSLILFPIDYCFFRSRNSSVGIATRYGLDGPGIESRWGRDFLHLSRQSLGPTQHHIQWVPCLSQG